MMDHDLDFPTHRYALDVIMGEILACKETIQACQRHIDDLNRDDIWFDEEAAAKFFRYCTRFKHYKGPKKGQPIDLDLWQKFIFGNIYGWKRCVNEGSVEEPDWVQTDLWRFTSAYIEVPKKNGKSTVCGAVASYDAYVMEETGAEVYCLATKEDQAKIVWNDCNMFVHNSEFRHMFKTVGKAIYVQGTDRSSFIKPLGRDSKSNDGLNPFSAIVDELHAHPNREILDIIEDGFVARENYHLIIITTAGTNQHGVCYQERTHSKRVLDKAIQVDNKFCIIYTVNDDEKKSWDVETSWFRANPGLGSIKSVESMREQVEKAKTLPSKRNTVLTKQLNIWTSVAEVWILQEFWEARVSIKKLEDMRGLKCYGGIDLARVHDMSCFAMLFPIQPGVDRLTLAVVYYIPEDNIMDRVKNDKVPYDVWAEEGYIKKTPGNTTDFGFIRKDILELAKSFNILAIGFDRHFGGDIVSGLQDEGLEMVEVGMGYVSMSDPSNEFERLIMSTDNELEYIANPVLDWNVGNTVIVKDPAGNIKPDKSKSAERIDGTVASIITLATKTFKEGAKGTNPYEKRGLRSLS
jgi:phage terminase large subunit-like protein